MFNLKETPIGRVIVQVSHNDLDGVGAVVIGKAKYGEHLNWFCVGNHEVDKKINEILDQLNDQEVSANDVTFIISDVSPGADTAERLTCWHMNGADIRLFDHHKTAEWLNAYAWAKVDASGLHCGTSLAYVWLNKPKAYGESYDLFVAMVRDYDLWVHQMPSSSKLNRLFMILGRDAFIDRFVGVPEPKFNSIEDHLIYFDEQSEDAYYKNVKKHVEYYSDNNGNGFIVGVCDRYTSNIGHRLLNDTGAEYVALIDPLKNKVSLRSKDIDVADVASILGGGGHPQASGFPMDFGYLHNFIAAKVKEVI